MATTQKIITNLWFFHHAEEAVKLYASLFKNSKTDRIVRYSDVGQEIHHVSAGSVMIKAC